MKFTSKLSIRDKKRKVFDNEIVFVIPFIGGSRGGLRELQPPFQISKIKDINKTKQKIEDNPLEKEEERKSCMFVYFWCVHALIRVSTNIFLSKFFSSTPPPFKKILDPRLLLITYVIEAPMGDKNQYRLNGTALTENRRIRIGGESWKLNLFDSNGKLNRAVSISQKCSWQDI